METNSGHDTPDEVAARASLDDAHRVEMTTRFPETPWWYFVVHAALLAGLVLAQLMPDNSRSAMTAVAILIIAINLGAARKAGVIGTTSASRGFVAALALVFLAIIGSFAWYEATGAGWTVVVSAGVVAVLVMAGGALYRRTSSER